MSIVGPGASIVTVARSTADGTPEFRVFTVIAGVNVNLSGLTVSGGKAVDGGGIDNSGSLTITDVTVTRNSASELGGGILNDGILSIDSSAISDNSTVGDGRPG